MPPTSAGGIDRATDRGSERSVPLHYRLDEAIGGIRLGPPAHTL